MRSAFAMTQPRLITGLSEIAPAYDALICDVWGVIHDGHTAYPAAAEALMRFRKERGPVILLTNAPRLPSDVAAQCASYGLPEGCYDAIVSSGGAAHDELARRSVPHSENSPLPLYYIGPDKDLGLMTGLPISQTGIEQAALALCTGLVDDLTETPDDYAVRLDAMRAKDLTMLCANPDLVVHRGPQLCYCAGALAKAYERIGGKVVYYGKPYLPIYDVALAAAGNPKKPLAVGDGLLTDIKGANAAGLDVLFIADGVHGDEVEPYSAAHLQGLFAAKGVHAIASARVFQW